MKPKHLLWLCVFASLLTSATVFAQHGAAGGGLMTEAEMQTYLNRLDDYIATPEGQKAFPEVAIHDHFSKPSFHQIVQATYPVAKPEVQHDQFGNPRTCVSYIEGSKRYFICNQNEFDMSLNHQPRNYELLLHELFVQAGIERPLDENIPSTYKISSHILNHLFRDEAWGWIPGSLPKNPITQSGLWCTDQPSIQSNEVSSQPNVRVLFWNKSGNIRLLALKQGKPTDILSGSQVLPTTIEQATQASGLTLAAGYRYSPLQINGNGQGPSIWLATNENLLLRSALSGSIPGSQLWTQILGNIFLQTNGVIEQHLVACQALDSWPQSPLYPFIGASQ